MKNIRNKYIDDLEFAKAWVQTRSEFHPRSSRALRIELHQKGIAEDQISETLANIDDISLAISAARKQSRRYQHLDWQSFRQKLGAFLSRRGFQYSDISLVVKKTWEEINEDRKNLIIDRGKYE